MKKNRWHIYHESKDGRMTQHETHEEKPNFEANPIANDPTMVSVPKDLLLDGVVDGRFKRANQKKLAELLGVEIKQRKK